MRPIAAVSLISLCLAAMGCVVKSDITPESRAQMLREQKEEDSWHDLNDRFTAVQLKKMYSEYENCDGSAALTAAEYAKPTKRDIENEAWVPKSDIFSQNFDKELKDRVNLEDKFPESKYFYLRDELSRLYYLDFRRKYGMTDDEVTALGINGAESGWVVQNEGVDYVKKMGITDNDYLAANPKTSAVPAKPAPVKTASK